MSREKHRIPAWCDRVLWKGKGLRNIAYDTSPLRFSDHRPVYAAFQTTVNVIDEAVKERLSRELYDQRRKDVGNVTANKSSAADADDEDLIGYDSIAPGLPPASSDRRKWWLDNGESELRETLCQQYSPFRFRSFPSSHEREDGADGSPESKDFQHALI